MLSSIWVVSPIGIPRIPTNRTPIFAIVSKVGVGNTDITISGSYKVGGQAGHVKVPELIAEIKRGESENCNVCAGGVEPKGTNTQSIFSYGHLARRPEQMPTPPTDQEKDI
ncbi:hypothetical protein XELAEV_18025402mg [Xenopus laevis]|uniref:Uncharacterized protein n=1 Tax=Xenopus laevis TaxID=8355 RepID=A0A974D0M2_XENLA|nr:hypothetical protein XELAEV_18025402mg [Xenopus laevis]